MARVRVKICGITRVADALAAADAGADAIGLVFYAGSPRCVTPAQARAVTARLPPFVTKVGLFVNPDAEAVAAVLGAVCLDVLQFHGDESPAFCSSFARPYVKAIRMRRDLDAGELCRRYEESAAAILLDGYSRDAYGGTGRSFDWRRAPQDRAAPIILAGGLTADNVRRSIMACRPHAVDVSSGVEIEPGVKDERKIATFIREVTDACAAGS